MITVEKMLTASAEESLGKELLLYKGHKEINIMWSQLFQEVLHEIL